MPTRPNTSARHISQRKIQLTNLISSQISNQQIAEWEIQSAQSQVYTQCRPAILPRQLLHPRSKRLWFRFRGTIRVRCRLPIQACARAVEGSERGAESLEERGSSMGREGEGGERFPGYGRTGPERSLDNRARCSEEAGYRMCP